MVSQQEEIFSVRRKRIYLRWFLLFLLIASLLVIPTIIAFDKQDYPNLDILLFFYPMAVLLWIAALVDFGPQASLIELHKDAFLVRKIGQKATLHPYSAIQSYYERSVSSGVKPVNELTVYLQENWFVIRSDNFQGYDYLKDQFTNYSQSGPRQKALTLSERNRFRWAVGGLALLIIGNIVFGYLAHNSADKNPAKLMSLTAVVDRASVEHVKGVFKGVSLKLQPWPDFTFFISHKSYDVDIRPLKQAILLKQPVTLLMRESDYRKKIQKTQPLTFGDKYDNYHQILVFGIDQGNAVHLMTDKPVYEPTHTNPTLRTSLCGMLLLFCWAGWVYVDQHKVLRAE